MLVPSTSLSESSLSCYTSSIGWPSPASQATCSLFRYRDLAIQFLGSLEERSVEGDDDTVVSSRSNQQFTEPSSPTSMWPMSRTSNCLSGSDVGMHAILSSLREFGRVEVCFASLAFRADSFEEVRKRLGPNTCDFSGA
jgi:hypothetical protein